MRGAAPDVDPLATACTRVEAVVAGRVGLAARKGGVQPAHAGSRPRPLPGLRPAVDVAVPGPAPGSGGGQIVETEEGVSTVDAGQPGVFGCAVDLDEIATTLLAQVVRIGVVPGVGAVVVAVTSVGRPAAAGSRRRGPGEVHLRQRKVGLRQRCPEGTGVLEEGKHTGKARCLIPEGNVHGRVAAGGELEDHVAAVGVAGAHLGIGGRHRPGVDLAHETVVVAAGPGRPGPVGRRHVAAIVRRDVRLAATGPLRVAAADQIAIGVRVPAGPELGPCAGHAAGAPAPCSVCGLIVGADPGIAGAIGAIDEAVDERVLGCAVDLDQIAPEGDTAALGARPACRRVAAVVLLAFKRPGLATGRRPGRRGRGRARQAPLAIIGVTQVLKRVGVAKVGARGHVDRGQGIDGGGVHGKRTGQRGPVDGRDDVLIGLFVIVEIGRRCAGRILAHVHVVPARIGRFTVAAVVVALAEHQRRRCG